ncbi:MAG: hypothetical protein CVU46_10570 [Chloroflexi bacterium HGW-Chloroflexi-8]|nr:MAG: hypothetical protein CVU46_10570 [Chloroflexi bacterium HGW-Chloroflexi-8]
MDDLMTKFPPGTRVITPKGSGIVVGYINRQELDQVIVSFDFHPLSISDRDENPVVVYAFPAFILNLPVPIPEVHKRFNFDFSLRSHEVEHGNS